MTMTIEELAQQESTATALRGRADRAWRSAWWATTLALGAYVKGSDDLGEAQRIVREVTGQSVQYVSERSSTGRLYVRLETNTEIPPRMAMEVVRQHITPTPAIIAEMLAIDEDPNRGMRDFYTYLTGRSWADTPAGMSPESIDKIVAAQPEAVAHAVAKVVDQHPAVVKKLSAVPAIQVETARQRKPIDGHPDQRNGRKPKSEHVPVNPNGMMTLLIAAGEVDRNLATIASMARDGFWTKLPQDVKNEMLTNAERWKNLLDLVKAHIESSNPITEDALQAWISGV
jgi:hypothetical protein